MKFLSCIGRFFIGLVKFIKNILFISFLFLLGVFVLAIIMPENVKMAIEIFKNII